MISSGPFILWGIRELTHSRANSGSSFDICGIRGPALPLSAVAGFRLGALPAELMSQGSQRAGCQGPEILCMCPAPGGG